jgi:hypothetical protein
MMHHTKASSKFEENIITNTNKNDRENDTRAQDNVAANSTEAKLEIGSQSIIALSREKTKTLRSKLHTFS